MRGRVLSLLPSALLVVVCLHQLSLARFEHLNPWKGGGFGMFSTTDRGSARSVRVLLSTPNGPVALAVPPEVEALRLRALQHPSERNLRAVGEAVIRHRRSAPPPGADVSVEVWLTRFDLDRRALRRSRLSALRLSWDDRAG